MSAVRSAGAVGRTAGPTLLAAVIVLAGVAAVGPAGAQAAGPTVSLTPAGPAGAKGYFVYSARAGSRITGQITVASTSSARGTVLLYAVDATTGQTTGAVYLSRARRRRDVGAWTKLPVRRVVLGSHGHAQVSFVVGCPGGARGGQHLGAIVAQPLTGAEALSRQPQQPRVPHQRTGAQRARRPGQRAGAADPAHDDRRLSRRRPARLPDAVHRDGQHRQPVREGDGERRRGQRDRPGTQAPELRGGHVPPRDGHQLSRRPRRQTAPRRALSAPSCRWPTARVTGSRATCRCTISSRSITSRCSGRPTRPRSRHREGSSGPSTLVVVLGGVALLGLGFGAAVLLNRRAHHA